MCTIPGRHAGRLLLGQQFLNSEQLSHRHLGRDQFPGEPGGRLLKRPALTTVSVGNFPTSALTLPFAIAQDQGYFRDAGLNVQAVSATSVTLASELIGGTTQIAVEVPPNAFPVMQQGESLVALPPYGRLDLAIVAPNGSGITGLKSLVGKKIGVTAVGAFTEKFAQYVLQTAGIDPASVTFVAVGALPTQVAALQHHTIDATVLSSDAIAAVTARGIKLSTLASSLGGTAGQLGAIGLQSFWATTSSYQTSHPTVVRGFCTAMSRATAFLADGANRSAGLPTIEKLLSVPAPVGRPGLGTRCTPRGRQDRRDQVGGQRQADPGQRD